MVIFVTGRCVFTTVNPDTGKIEGLEPLRTLKKVRRGYYQYPVVSDEPQEAECFFGIQLAHDGEGEINCGDALKVLEVGPAIKYL